MNRKCMQSAWFVCSNAQFPANLVRLEPTQIVTRGEIDACDRVRGRQEAVVAMIGQIDTAVWVGGIWVMRNQII